MDFTSDTTILACPYQGGIIVAADSQTNSAITHQATNVDLIKHVKLAPKLYISGSGVRSEINFVLAELKTTITRTRRRNSNQNLTQTAALQCRLTIRKKRFSAGFFISGWNAEVGCQLFLVRHEGIDKVERAHAIGTGGRYLRNPYLPGYPDSYLSFWRSTMSEKEARDFVAAGVAFAIKMDPQSGGNIRILAFDSQGNLNKWKRAPDEHNRGGYQYVRKTDF